MSGGTSKPAHIRHGQTVIQVSHISQPMPRFRRKKPDITLTELVRQILNRAACNNKPFAVFFFDLPKRGKRAVLCAICTDRFKAMSKRYPDALIGTYNKGISAIALMDDLSEFFAIKGDE